MKCPNCGNTDPKEFYYWEWVTSTREILAQLPDGTIVYGDQVQSHDDDKEPHLGCSACNQWDAPIPDEVPTQYGWIDKTGKLRL